VLKSKFLGLPFIYSFRNGSHRLWRPRLLSSGSWSLLCGECNESGRALQGWLLPPLQELRASWFESKLLDNSLGALLNSRNLAFGVGNLDNVRH
jgi:hypothetical protein